MTQKRLKELVRYDKHSGYFTNIKKKRVGTPNDKGYLTLWLDGKNRKAHRMAWLYMHGKLPIEIDHVNHNKADNRLINLRDVTRKENMRNVKKGKGNNSGEVGVGWDKDNSRWRARITVDAKVIHLGRFSLYSDAVNARKNAEVLYGFHKNHGA